MKAFPFLEALLLVVLFTTCKKDSVVVPKDYPYVITNMPAANPEGAIFSANLVSSGKQKILRYGFVWSEKDKPELTDDHKIFEGSIAEGAYSFDLKSALEEGKTYMVRAYIQTENFEIFGNSVSFESQGSLPPVISSITPEYGPIGTEVTILGENFSNSLTGNKVQIGSIIATIVSASQNSLSVAIPMITKPETGKITVTVAGMTATSAKSFDMWFPWLQKTDFPGDYLYNASSFAIGNSIYICGGLTPFFLDPQKTFWEYNTINDVWTQKPDFPGEARQGAIAFSCNGKGYFGMGSKNSVDEYLLDLWEYDPSTEQWTKKTSFPGTPVIYAKAMVINNKAYIGPGKYWANFWGYFVSDFWEYDPSPDVWTKKSNFPGSEQQNYIAIGTKDKGYIGAGSNGLPQPELFEYDPKNNSWQLAGVYPGKGNYDIANFYINDKLYMGLGQNSSSYADSDFWEFDPVNRTWKEMHSLPITFAPDESQTVNNRGYVLSGYEPKGRKIFEFDPTMN